MARGIDRKFFFDSIRSWYGGLTDGQVSNMGAILLEIEEAGIENPYWVGAILSTVRTEVGAAMAPVREGFAKTDAAARAHVASLYKAGKISRNYALPDPETGMSYYGRGYPQTTHKENYLKSGIAVGMGDAFVRNPDLLLTVKWAAKAMVAMMLNGGYRGKSLQGMLGDGVPTNAMMIASRDIINGDANKRRGNSKTTIGQTYAADAFRFAAAVRFEEKVDTKPVPADNNPATEPGFWSKLWTAIKEYFK